MTALQKLALARIVAICGDSKIPLPALPDGHGLDDKTKSQWDRDRGGEWSEQDRIRREIKELAMALYHEA
jgi:hypothetical protein